MEIKVSKIMPHVIIVFILLFSAYISNGMLNQDCEERPPQHCYYTSNNIIDNNYTACKITQYEEDNLIFPDKPEINSCLHNGERISVEFKKTKYVCSDSNATADYRFCK